MKKYTFIIAFCIVCFTALTSVSASFLATSDFFTKSAKTTTEDKVAAFKNAPYIEDGAVYTMTTEPNDTVTKKQITLAGSIDTAGTITMTQNDTVIIDSQKITAAGTFTKNITLQNGRNEIEIYHEDSNGTVSRKSYNIVYLTEYDIVVDKNFTGTDGTESDGVTYYSTVQAADNAISKNNKEQIVIFVKNGTYKEKITIDKPYVSIIGEDSEKTVLTYDVANGTIVTDADGNIQYNPDGSIQKYGTGGSASVTIKNKATGFTAENITFENSFVEGTYGGSGEQAVAVNNQADQSVFVNCRFYGNQDTLLTEAPGIKLANTSDEVTEVADGYKTRQYYYKSYIEGDVDFIFGRAQAGFEDCDIVSLDRGSKNNNGYVTAASTWDVFNYGYIFMNCRLLGEEGIADNSVSLGRPWHPNNYVHANARVAYINTYMGSHITTKGWDNMSGFLASDADFFEYGSYGPGSKTSSTRPLLTDAAASSYTLENLFSSNYSSVWNYIAGLNEMYIPANLAPTFTLDSALPKETSEAKVTITGSLDLDAYVTISVNGTNQIDKEKHAALQSISNSITLAEGSNTIVITAESASGNKTSETYEIIFEKEWSLDDLFTLSDVAVTDFSGEAIEEISGGMTVVAKVTSKNNSLLAQQGTIVIGLYNENGKLVSSGSIIESFKKQEEKTFTSTFIVPTGSNYTIKAFIK